MFRRLALLFFGETRDKETRDKDLLAYPVSLLSLIGGMIMALLGLRKMRFGARTARARTAQRQWEAWVTVCDHAKCRALDGKRYVAGKGPVPGVDTPVGCLCYRERVLGRAQRAPAPSTRRFNAPRGGSFAVYSSKD